MCVRNVVSSLVQLKVNIHIPIPLRAKHNDRVILEVTILRLNLAAICVINSIKLN